MRNTLRIALVGAALSAVSFTSAASAATSATANATAEVLSTLTLTADSALNFGQIAANTGGDVIVNADGTVASTGSLISTGTRAPAGFTVGGTPNANVVVTLPVSATLTRQTGTETMTITAFNSNPPGAFQLNGLGAGTFSVGGTLTVASGQVAGVYNGNFNVSVEYQ
jgi:large exoprotein involved in heme utilization and adhesion